MIVWAWLPLLLALPAQRIEGDVELLNALQTAQKANLSRYPHGELEAVIDVGQKGRLNFLERSRVKVRWLGERSRVTCSWTELRNRESISEPELVNRHWRTEYWLLDGTKSTHYFKDVHRLQVHPLASFTPPPRSRATPAGFWYGRLGGEGIPWLNLIDPAEFRGKTPVGRLVYQVRRLDHDRVEVKRIDPVLQFNLTVVCSLALDGNVISYESAMPRSNYTKQGSYTWRRDNEGRCFLSRLEDHMYHTVKGERIDVFMISETERFDPDVEPGKDEFDLPSLPVEPGTLVEDYVRRRNYLLGEPPVESMRVKLDRLVDAVRAKGFASESRR